MHYDPFTGKPIEDNSDQKEKKINGDAPQEQETEDWRTLTSLPEEPAEGETAEDNTADEVPEETMTDETPEEMTAGETPETADDSTAGDTPEKSETPPDGETEASYNEASYNGFTEDGRSVYSTGGGPDMVPPKRKKTGLYIGIGAAAAAVVAAVVLKFTVFVDPAQKIIDASKYTFSEEGDPLAEQFADARDIVESNDFSIEAGIDMDTGESYGSAGIDMDYNQNKTGQSMTLDVSYDTVKLNIVETLDDEKLVVDLGDLYDDPLMYSYTEDKSGSYLEEMAGEDTLDIIDSGCTAWYSMISKGVSTETDKLEEDFKELDFEKGGSANISGYSCTCYKTTMTKEWLTDYYKDAMNINSTEELNEFADLITNGEFSSIPDLFDELGDCDMKCYISGKRLVGLDLKSEQNGEIEMRFTGEDVPWHHMEYKVSGTETGDTKMELDTKVRGSKSTYNLTVDDQKIKMTYDSDSDKFRISADSEKIADGTIKTSSDKMEINADASNEDMDMSMDITLKTGSKLAEIDGDPVDIVDLSETEWEELYNTVTNNLSGTQDTLEENFDSTVNAL